MKLLGCFKVVPDLDLIAEEDWNHACKELKVDTKYVRTIWNCFDEGALEMLLRLSDLSESFSGICELTALTIGKKNHESYLKTLYALKYQHAVRIEEEEEILFCPERVADLIAAYVEKVEMQDVIVLSGQSADGNNMKTPYLVAEKLGVPCISEVTQFEIIDENTISVKSDLQDYRRTWMVKTPCVIAMGNSASAYLRIPTLKDKMTFGKKEIIRIKPEELLDKVPRSNVELVSINEINNKREPEIISGDTPLEKAKSLYENYLKGRLRNI